MWPSLSLDFLPLVWIIWEFSYLYPPQHFIEFARCVRETNEQINNLKSLPGITCYNKINRINNLVSFFFFLLVWNTHSDPWPLETNEDIGQSVSASMWLLSTWIRPRGRLGFHGKGLCIPSFVYLLFCLLFVVVLFLSSLANSGFIDLFHNDWDMAWFCS